MAEAGFAGQTTVEFVHKRKGKVVTQGYTEYTSKCTKCVSIDFLNHRVTENIMYRDGRMEVKDFKNPVKYWSIRLKMFGKKIKMGVK
jgi:hypothetical protein